jgi:hypothetical protein
VTLGIIASSRRRDTTPATVITDTWTGTTGAPWSTLWTPQVASAGSSSVISSNRGRITVAATPVDPGPGPGEITTAFATLGAFRASNSPSSIAQFESSAGINRTMPGPIVDFAGGGPNSFAQRRSSINGCLDAWAPRCVAGNDVLILSLRPWPTALGGQLAAMAAGDFDAEYTADAQSFLARGYTANNLILRPMWEFNGAFYPHSIVTSVNPGGAADYVTGWRRMVDRIRALIPGMRFDWSSLRLTLSEAAVEAAYPGDAWVDYIGMDAYNWRSSTDDLNLRWTRLVQGGTTAGSSVGLQWHRDFAVAHSKPMTFAEWGVTRRPIGGTITNSQSPVSDGGDDDGTYIANFIDWCDDLGAAGLLHSHCYFERDAVDAWHQLHDYSGDAALYDFFTASKAAFDARMRG